MKSYEWMIGGAMHPAWFKPSSSVVISPLRGPEGQGATCHAPEAFHGPCRAQWTAGQHSAQPPAQRLQGGTTAGGERFLFGAKIWSWESCCCIVSEWTYYMIIYTSVFVFYVLSLLLLPDTSECNFIRAWLRVFLGICKWHGYSKDFKLVMFLAMFNNTWCICTHVAFHFILAPAYIIIHFFDSIRATHLRPILDSWSSSISSMAHNLQTVWWFGSSDLESRACR